MLVSFEQSYKKRDFAKRNCIVHEKRKREQDIFLTRKKID